MRWRIQLCAAAGLPFVLMAAGPDAQGWFVRPPPSPTRLITRANDGGKAGTENIVVLARHAIAPTQADPHPAFPLNPSRDYEEGASWGSSHPGEFCCATQYETGLDGQAGR